eukprot:GHVU01127795.1.p1 GENE.GHVU01127795.1~~GHVU01127795.1.p1  ORF type:complete len:251 (+),score=60.45 GHVU01127795.1:401-1153(+)
MAEEEATDAVAAENAGEDVDYSGRGTTVIVDVGSGFVKAGLQTDEIPSVVFPTVVGRPRRRYANDEEGNPAFVGADAIAQRHQLSFTYPIDHGHVSDWLEVEEIWNHCFHSVMQISPSEHTLLLTEPPLCSHAHRTRSAEVGFEVYNFREINISIQGIMSLYNAGRTTGVVVEIGDGVTQVVPITDGYAEKTALRRQDIGGQEITMYLQRLLSASGYTLLTRDELEYVRIIKENYCYVALDPHGGSEEDR